MATERRTLAIEDARIAFRNFSGRETRYNKSGDRNFCVLLEPHLAEELVEEGWNVKVLAPREEDDDPQPYIQVNLSYASKPPNVVIVTQNGRTNMDEESVGVLDWADILNVDLILRPYHWEVNGKTGIKGYVKTMYVTIEEDEFADKYRDEEDN